MTSSTIRNWRAIAFALAAAFISASCDSNGPTGPSDDGGGGSSGNGSIQISVVPNPVPHSGQPISDVPGCAELPFTWFYDQVIRETSGVDVTFTARTDRFDGNVVNNLNGINITVPANGQTTVRTRWCSGNKIAHTAQTTFSGTDANGNAVNIDAPEANLRP